MWFTERTLVEMGLKVGLLIAPFLFHALAGAKDGSLTLCTDQTLIKNCWIKPCSISLNFNGVSKPDVAHLVSQGKDGAKGIAIILDEKTCVLAGAGKEIGSGSDDFNWMNIWSLRKNYREQKDGLLVLKDEIGGTLLWKNGQLAWEQGGD